MHSAAYFVPPRHVPTMHMPSEREKQSVDASMGFTTAERKEAFGQKAFKILLVAVLHFGLFAWLAQVDTGQREIHSPVRLDVRTIVIPTAAPVAQAGIAEEIKTPPRLAKPASPRVKQPAPQKQLKPAAPSKPVQEILSTTSSEAAFSLPEQAAQESAHSKSPEPAAPAASAASSTSSASGATSAARFDADYLRNPAPDYPSVSRRMREEGTVYLDVSVTAEGRAGDLRIRKSSGHARLDEAALGAVRQWRFVPARRGAEAVAAQVVVPVVFRLGD